MRSPRRTAVLVVAFLSIGFQATAGYPAGVAELRARQCCSRHCPRRSPGTPARCKCCHQTPDDERLFVPRVAWPLGNEPMVVTSRLVRLRSYRLARVVELVDRCASGPPLFLATHHIQR